MQKINMKISRADDICSIADELRKTVFIEEQNVPYEEIFDNNNNQAYHIVAFEGDMAVATARILKIKDSKNYQIGLVAVAKEKRGQNFGKKVMELAIKFINPRAENEIFLTAQQEVCGFYEKLGFKQSGEVTVFESGFVLVPMKYIINI